MIKAIESLSKEELLGLIYHYLPETLFFDHPCECATCGSHPSDELKEMYGKKVEVYFYICDSCVEYDRDEE